MEEKSYVAWKQFGNWNVTVRSDDWKELKSKIETADRDLGTKPLAGAVTLSTGTPKIDREATDICPVCGSALVEGQSKDGTKHFLKCSTSKWDPTTKTATGCTYIKWL